MHAVSQPSPFNLCCSALCPSSGTLCAFVAVRFPLTSHFTVFVHFVLCVCTTVCLLRLVAAFAYGVQSSTLRRLGSTRGGLAHRAGFCLSTSGDGLPAGSVVNVFPISLFKLDGWSFRHFISRSVHTRGVPVFSVMFFALTTLWHGSAGFDFLLGLMLELTARVIFVTVHRFVLPGSIRPSVFDGTRPPG